MSSRPLDPGLAAILASIRETVGGARPADPGLTDSPEAEQALPPAAPAAAPVQTALTLEAFVRRIAEPHIKAWLDANLPEIVQREVAKAVDRLVNPEG